MQENLKFESIIIWEILNVLSACAFYLYRCLFLNCNATLYLCFFNQNFPSILCLSNQLFWVQQEDNHLLILNAIQKILVIRISSPQSSQKLVSNLICKVGKWQFIHLFYKATACHSLVEGYLPLMPCQKYRSFSLIKHCQFETNCSFFSSLLKKLWAKETLL